VEYGMWATLHDERITMKFSDLEEDVQHAFVQGFIIQGATQKELIELQYSNLQIKFSYACPRCYACLSALTGWNYRQATRSRSGKYKCTTPHCSGTWSCESGVSVCFLLKWSEKQFAFYGHWGYSDYVKNMWPKVYQRWRHWRIIRSEFYAKFTPDIALRDEPVDFSRVTRVQLAPSIEEKFHHLMLKDYYDNEDNVNDELLRINEERLLFFVKCQGRMGWMHHRYTEVERLMERDKTFLRRNDITRPSNYLLGAKSFEGVAPSEGIFPQPWESGIFLKDFKRRFPEAYKQHDWPDLPFRGNLREWQDDDWHRETPEAPCRKKGKGKDGKEERIAAYPPPQWAEEARERCDTWGAAHRQHMQQEEQNEQHPVWQYRWNTQEGGRGSSSSSSTGSGSYNWTWSPASSHEAQHAAHEDAESWTDWKSAPWPVRRGDAWY